MKRAQWMLVLGITLLAACGPPPPPAGTVEALGVAPLEAPPVFALIGVRERLQLSSEQISALDSIGRWNASANETALRQLRRRDARGAPAADVPLDSLVLLVRQNNQQATQGVEALLTERQQEQVCTIFPARERRAPPAGARRTPRDQDRALAGGDPRQFVWPWCLPAEERPAQQPPPQQPPPTEPTAEQPAPPASG